MPSLYSIATIGLAGLTLVSADWQTAQCTDPDLTNAAINPATRWSAANATDAWQAAVQAWNGGAVSSGNIALTFAESVSNFFHGPDQWNCQDVGDVPCSGVVQCDSTNHPAGWLILDSFSSLHQFHQHIYNALQGAESNMAPNMGTFASTFAPQVESDEQLLSDLLAGIAAIVGLGSAFAWNVAVKEAGIFTNDNYRGFAKDVFNSQVSFAIAVGKNHLPAAESALGTQNSISSSLSSVVSSWQGVETGVLQALFAGDSGSIGNLTALFQDGMMTQVPNNVDLSSLTAEAEKILYGQLIPIAWKLAPGNLQPIILRTSEPCSSKATGVVNGFMTDDTAAQTHICYDGYTFYLVNAHYKDTTCLAKECPVAPDGGDMQFQQLPGGTFDVLSGGNWGGVSVNDIIISSYQGYQLNGYKNGYQMPELSSYIDGNGTEGDLVFQNSIQTPGFFSVPICQDVDAAILRIAQGPANGDPNWPCGTGTGSPMNNQGTNVHVNAGCISFGTTKRCQPDSYNVAYQNSGTSTTTIYARFDPSNTWEANVTAPCKLSAQFPATDADIYFGQDNCLYDSSSNQINGQCCTATTTDQVPNPYYNGSPKPGTQGTDIIVNSGCISINGSKRCSPNSYNVAYQNNSTSTATIYAKFDKNDKSATVTPGCKLDAHFPASYAQVHFGNDNCIYGDGGDLIDGQCCSDSTSDQVPNPYL